MAVLGQQAVTPVFDGATEDEIHKATEEANKAVRERRKQRVVYITVDAVRHAFVEIGAAGAIESIPVFARDITDIQMGKRLSA